MPRKARERRRSWSYADRAATTLTAKIASLLLFLQAGREYRLEIRSLLFTGHNADFEIGKS